MNDLTLYTIEEVADILKVTPRTLYTYIKNSELEAVKIGKYWRVKHASLQMFIDERTEKIKPL